MMWKANQSLMTFENVRVPKSNLIGALNRGWYVGATLLDFERSVVDRPARAARVLSELVEFCKQITRYRRPLSEDSLVRSRLARMAVEIEATRMMCLNIAWMQSKREVPNKEASITKAFGSEMMTRIYWLGMQLMGPFDQLEPSPKWVPLQGRIENAYMRSGRDTVAAGTSEIQRNIIATRGLGLPRG